MFDIILSGGTIIDGTRAIPYKADVCIKDGKIAKIAENVMEESAEKVDISGLAVSPAFIDIHSHSDLSPLVNYTVESKLAQGVGTEVTGNCGISCLPSTSEHKAEVDEYVPVNLELPLYGIDVAKESVSDYAEDVRAHGSSLNYAPLVGHGTLRLAVMGFVNRDPSQQEMEDLKALLAREMERGAFGMSLGLIYPPSAFSSKDELIELAKVIAKYDGILAVHMRNEGPRVFQAVDEMIEITRASGVHLEISHLKVMGKPQWGRSGEILAKIDAAKAEGMNITCDQYPFIASSTSLTALVPHWAHAGGAEGMMGRLRSKEGTICEEISQEMENRGGPETILITSSHGYHPEYEGKYISDLAKEFGLSFVDTVIKVLLDCETSVACVYFCMDKKDMLNIMSRMDICTGSDGYSLSYDPQYTKTNPHPRNFATFPEFFKQVRENNLMPIEDAVYKVTGLPASILHLHERGIIKVGTVADLTVFDPMKIDSRSTFMDSKIRPIGIPHVIINGKFALKDGVITDAREGKVLMHQ